VNVGSKEVVDSLFLFACMDLGRDYSHKRGSARQVIMQLQERAESERTVPVEKMKKERRLVQSMTDELDIPPGVTLPRKLAPSERLIGCDASVSDFWAWAYSDLLLNIDRAVFAEFAVGYALGVTRGTRRTWDCVDHEYKGKKIEVKATGLAQRFRVGKKRSPPSFDIAKHVCIKWGEPAAEPGAPTVRSADCYVFCIHTDTDAASANPLNVNNWEFLVMSKQQINEIFGDQKSVALSVLEKHSTKGHCTKTDYNGLKTAVDTCLAEC